MLPRSVTLALLLLLLGCEPPAAPLLTLDHLFVLVPPGGRQAQLALEHAGFTLDTNIVRHEGGGTASVGLLFDNAYLELLWVDSSVPFEPGALPRITRFRKAVPASPSSPSPFGVGLRRLAQTPDALPWPSRPYHAAWMDPGEDIQVLCPAADSLPSPRIFVVPRSMAHDAWVEEVRQESPALFRHALGVHTLTQLEIRAPKAALATLPGRHGAIAGLSLKADSDHLAILTFDGGTRGRTLDLRPTLPLLARF